MADEGKKQQELEEEWQKAMAARLQQQALAMEEIEAVLLGDSEAVKQGDGRQLLQKLDIAPPTDYKSFIAAAKKLGSLTLAALACTDAGVAKECSSHWSVGVSKVECAMVVASWSLVGVQMIKSVLKEANLNTEENGDYDLLTVAGYMNFFNDDKLRSKCIQEIIRHWQNEEVNEGNKKDSSHKNEANPVAKLTLVLLYMALTSAWPDVRSTAAAAQPLFFFYLFIVAADADFFLSDCSSSSSPSVQLVKLITCIHKTDLIKTIGKLDAAFVISAPLFFKHCLLELTCSYSIRGARRTYKGTEYTWLRQKIIYPSFSQLPDTIDPRLKMDANQQYHILRLHRQALLTLLKTDNLYADILGEAQTKLDKLTYAEHDRVIELLLDTRRLLVAEEAAAEAEEAKRAKPQTKAKPKREEETPLENQQTEKYAEAEEEMARKTAATDLSPPENRAFKVSKPSSQLHARVFASLLTVCACCCCFF
jgi:hypothetical protein